MLDSFFFHTTVRQVHWNVKKKKNEWKTSFWGTYKLEGLRHKKGWESISVLLTCIPRREIITRKDDIGEGYTAQWCMK